MKINEAKLCKIQAQGISLINSFPEKEVEIEISNPEFPKLAFLFSLLKSTIFLPEKGLNIKVKINKYPVYEYGELSTAEVLGGMVEALQVLQQIKPFTLSVDEDQDTLFLSLSF
jgi:hypothetical protein